MKEAAAAAAALQQSLVEVKTMAPWTSGAQVQASSVLNRSPGIA
jgi:hypothetical protein